MICNQHERLEQMIIDLRADLKSVQRSISRLTIALFCLAVAIAGNGAPAIVGLLK